MDSFTTVILLGLLTLGHATPLILEEHHLTSLTTQAPSEERTSTNVVFDNSTAAAESVKAESEEHVATEPMDEEGSATEEDQDSSAGRVQRHSDASMSSTAEPTHSSTTSPQSEDKITAHPLYNMTEEGSGESEEETATTVSTTTTEMVHFMTEEGSGVEETMTTTEMTSAASTISTTAFIFMTSEGSGQSDDETQTTTSATSTTRVMLMSEGFGELDEETTTAAPTTMSTEETTAAILPPSGDEEPTTTSVTTDGIDMADIDHDEEVSPTMTVAEETTTAIEAPFGNEEFIKRSRGMGPLGSQNEVSTEQAVSPMTLKDPQPLENPTDMPKGHVTPDWVIILGFLVGVAVLVLLCVGIATRDKWNRPNQFNNTIDTSPASQEKATELETFLYNEQPPKENGKAEEYTVIPLDELPDNYSS